MSFNIIFYNNSAEPNRLDKTNYLQNPTTFTGVLRSETDIVNPSILLEKSTFQQFTTGTLTFNSIYSDVNLSIPGSSEHDIFDYNYCYIETFKRYYFVVGIISVKEGLWEINLTCDVLMTYKDQILQQTAFIDRQENIYDEEIVDSNRVYEEGVDVEVLTVNPTDPILVNVPGKINGKNILVTGLLGGNHGT